MGQQSNAIAIFCCYAHEDIELLYELKKHLSPLLRQNVVDVRYDGDISAGTEWEQEIKKYLNEAKIILLLISSDFVNSDNCYSTEMQHALERYKRKEAKVIPIILRPIGGWEKVSLGDIQLGQFQALPKDAKAVTTWTNRDQAWKTVTEGIERVVNELLRESAIYQSTIPLGVPPSQNHQGRIDQAVYPGNLQVNSSAITQRVRGQNTVDTPYSPLEQHNVGSSKSVLSLPITHIQRQQNRTRMLERVRVQWITEFLEPSFQGMTPLILELCKQPTAVINPWKDIVLESTRLTQSLPSGTTTIQVYDQANGDLLILGEPGSGKTTLLLELARDLLDRATLDEIHLIPVVFHLSSWARKRQLLQHWLIDEMSIRYQVPRQLGQSWIEANQIIPLLDGFDEIPAAYQDEGIQAINAYHKTHHIPLVVCSRKDEYLALNRRFQLQDAIIVQPLTSQQINAYLSDAEGIRTTLRANVTLQEFANTPLVLRILKHAYLEKDIEASLIEGSFDTQKHQIFANYIQRMFERRETETRYTPQQTIFWLAWLARQMNQHNQAEFYLEHIQLTWLPFQLRWLFHAIIVGCVYGSLCWIVHGMIYEFVAGVLDQPISEFLLSLAIGIIIGFGMGLLSDIKKGSQLLDGKNKKSQVRIPKHTFVQMSNRLLPGFCFGLLNGFIIAFVIASSNGVPKGLMFGAEFGVMFWIAFELLGTIPREIQLAETLTWSWANMWHDLLKFLRNGLAAGFIISIVITIGVKEIFKHQASGIIIFLGLWFGITFLIVFLGSIVGGFSSQVIEKDPHMRPNQAIWRSARNAIRLGVITGLASGIIIGLAFGLGLSLIYNYALIPTLWRAFSIYGVRFGLVTGFVVCLRNGGLACIQHGTIRLLLLISKSTPGNYIRFLEYTTRRTLLRRVGGSYIFIHNLLLEYFIFREGSFSSTEAMNINITPIKKKKKRALKVGAIVIIGAMIFLIGMNRGSIYWGTQSYMKDVYATSTALSTTPGPYPPYAEKLALYDPLSQPFYWHDDSTAGGDLYNGSYCKFMNAIYHVRELHPPMLFYCPATPIFSNFAFEIQISTLEGDCGGVFFRDNDSGLNKGYGFSLCQNGTYNFFMNIDGRDGQRKEIITSRESSFIKKGQNQPNLLAVVAKDTSIILYVNHQQIAHIQDNTYTKGQIVLFADAKKNVTEVIFSQAKLWTL